MSAGRASQLLGAVLAVGLAGALLLGSGNAVADSWAIEVPLTHVPIGQPIVLTVFGPPDSTFDLYLVPPPWNGVAPLFSQEFNTTNATKTGLAVVNVTIPTAAYYQAEYDLILSTSGQVQNSSYVWLVPTSNDTYLNNTWNSWYPDWLVQQAVIFNLREQVATQGQQEWWDRILFGAGMAGVVLWEVHEHRRKSNPRYLWRTRRWWNSHRRPTREIHSYTTEAEANLIAPPVREAIYRGRWACCRNADWALEALLSHIRREHGSELGPSGPIKGRDYFVSKASRQLAESFHRPVPTRLTFDEKRQVRMADAPLDLDEVMDG